MLSSLPFPGTALWIVDKALPTAPSPMRGCQFTSPHSTVTASWRAVTGPLYPGGTGASSQRLSAAWPSASWHTSGRWILCISAFQNKVSLLLVDKKMQSQFENVFTSENLATGQQLVSALATGLCVCIQYSGQENVWLFVIDFFSLAFKYHLISLRGMYSFLFMAQ